jgi:hypothetical protein
VYKVEYPKDPKPSNNTAQIVVKVAGCQPPNRPQADSRNASRRHTPGLGPAYRADAFSQREHSGGGSIGCGDHRARARGWRDLYVRSFGVRLRAVRGCGRQCADSRWRGRRPRRRTTPCGATCDHRPRRWAPVAGVRNPATPNGVHLGAQPVWG